jgi:hypothetical protein
MAISIYAGESTIPIGVSSPAGVSGYPGISGNLSSALSINYVAEDGSSPYVAENGIDNYITES